MSASGSSGPLVSHVPSVNVTRAAWREVQCLQLLCAPICCSHNKVADVYNFDRISFEYFWVHVRMPSEF